MSTTPLNWEHLRALEGSQDHGFEELCCQLARHEDNREAVLRDGSFTRVGTPDAGVECYWTLPDGTMWGWQAKWYLKTPSSSQWSEVGRSVTTALAKRPGLRRYYVCLPLDLPDAPAEGRTTAHQVWKNRVAEWQGAAGRDGLEFRFWGASELWDRLSQDQHRGRLWFWFNTAALTSTWFRQHVVEARQGKGLDGPPSIDVRATHRLKELARAPELFQRIAEPVGRIEAATRERDEDDWSEPARAAHRAVVAEAVAWAVATRRFLARQGDDQIGASELATACLGLTSRLQEAVECLDDAEQPRSEGGPRHGYLTHTFRQAEHDLRGMATALLDAAAADAVSLAIEGPAGSGKSHLAYQVAQDLALADRPAIVVSARGFAGGDPWQWIAARAGLGCDGDQLLGALGAAAEAAGARDAKEAERLGEPAALRGGAVRALILIDALNEADTAGRASWREHIPEMLARLAHHPRVALAMTVREEYAALLPEPGSVPEGRLVRLHHPGFGNSTRAAVRAFFSHYGLVQPSSPFLDPEYSNPLFLKLLCVGLSGSGQRVVPRGVAGIRWVFERFLDHVNARLADATRLDYEVRKRKVQHAVEALAAAMAQVRRPWLPEDQAEALLESIHPSDGRQTHSLVAALMEESVLSMLPAEFEKPDGPATVWFTYNRLSDFLVVEQLLAPSFDAGNPRKAFASGGDLSWLVDPEPPTRYADWRAAAAVVLPERHGCELLALLDRPAQPADDYSARHRTHEAVEQLVQSLVWRCPAACSDATNELINRYVVHGGWCWHEFLSALLSLALVPQHPYNADGLHRWLAGQSMAHRDGFWPSFVFDEHAAAEESEGIVWTALEWAITLDPDELDGDTSRLAALLLGWLLATPTRAVRDTATKALVRLCNGQSERVIELLEAFREVDEPYVQQRLVVVAYGVVLRSRGTGEGAPLARYVWDRFFVAGPLPVDILLRDAARGVIEVALADGEIAEGEVDLVTLRPPYESEPPAAAPTDDELRLREPRPENPSREERARRALCNSVAGYADFARYVIGDNDAHFEWCAAPVATAPDVAANGSDEPNLDLRELKRWVLGRAFELGWSERLHGAFDARMQEIGGHLSYHETRKPERIGKKYQWIAWHECLARIADNYRFRPDPWDDERDLYRGPWQLTDVRDLDPSCLLFDREEAKPAAPAPWWSPVPDPEWGRVEDDHGWVRSEDGLPEVAPLLRVREPGAERDWLPLELHVQWTQPTPWDQREYSSPRRHVWYQVRGYFVHAGDVATFREWAREQNWMGQWMPDAQELRDRYLGEFYLPHCFEGQVYSEGADDWSTNADRDGQLPVPVVVPTAQYMSVGTYDASHRESHSHLVPSPWLMRAMGLVWRGVEGEWRAASNELAVLNPAPDDSGPLLVEAGLLCRFMEAQGLALVWTVLGEKQILSMGRGGYPGWGRVLGDGHTLANGELDVDLEFLPPEPREPAAADAESSDAED